MLRWVSHPLPPKKNTLAAENASSSNTVFTEVAKQTSFCREFNCPDSQIRIFCVFYLFPVKKNTTQTKKRNIRKMGM